MRSYVFLFGFGVDFQYINNCQFLVSEYVFFSQQKVPRV